MWLGFYTKWLTLASIVSVVTFIMAIIISQNSTVASQVCSRNDTIICRQCELESCKYKKLSKLCGDRKMSDFIVSLLSFTESPFHVLYFSRVDDELCTLPYDDRWVTYVF